METGNVKEVGPNKSSLYIYVTAYIITELFSQPKFFLNIYILQNHAVMHIIFDYLEKSIFFSNYNFWFILFFFL